MNINKLDKAFTCKYELYDINHKRLLPKEIVAFRQQSTLGKGIIISVNPKTTTIVSLNNKDKTYTIPPNEQIIISNLIENKEGYYHLYEEIVNKRKQRFFIRYAPCLIVNKTKTDLEKYKILILKYKINASNNSNKAWTNFLNIVKTNQIYNLKNYDIYVFCNDNYFYDLYTTKYQDINYIGNNNGGQLLYNHYEITNVLDLVNYVEFPIDKNGNLYFMNNQVHTSWNTPVKYVTINSKKYFFIDKNVSYFYNLYVRKNNCETFSIGISEIRKKYESK